MFSTLFKTKSIIDSSTKKWILDTFIWTFEQFEQDCFHDETSLILPTNAFYSGQVASVHEMAQAIFDNSINYAGMKNWPIVLKQPEYFQQQAFPALTFEKSIRGAQATLVSGEGNNAIPVSYNPSQINQPQDLIAAFAQTFAGILITHKQQLPPGGKDFIPQAIDLLAIFMGFGVMLSNTAYQFKGGCGSCYNARANRVANLPEVESLYCLAVFAVLKNIPIKQVSTHLKAHLRKDFKSAYKEIKQEVMNATSPLALIAQSFDYVKIK